MRGLESFKATGSQNGRERLEGDEEAIAIADFGSYLKNTESLERCRPGGWDDVCKDAVVESTQYQFLLSHFLLNNSNDKAALEVFWRRLSSRAREAHALEKLEALRLSVLSQVAVLKSLKRLGFAPHIAHPDEDAFEAIDVWADENAAVQIKGARHSDIAVEEADTLEFPGIAMKSGGFERHFNTRYTEEKFKKFSVKVNKYNEKYRTNPDQEKIKGYFIVVPEEHFSYTTGEPDEEFIETLRAKLAEEKILETIKKEKGLA